MKTTGRVIACIVGLIWVVSRAFSSSGRGEFVVSVLDVGQGDAILLEFPEGMTLLVDGGGGAEVLSELGEVLMPWKRTLDIVVLTHDHDDHLGGLFDVLSRYRVTCIMLRKMECTSFQCVSLLRLAIDRKVNVVDIDEIENGARVAVGGVELSIFYVKELLSGESVNDASVVLLVKYGAFSALLTGDLEESGEGELNSVLDGILGSQVILLKAGHHCSRTASSDEFLNIVNPVVVVCSVGEGNSFGHPHRETLEKYRKRQIRILRTDSEGRVTILTDGIRWRAETSK